MLEVKNLDVYYGPHRALEGFNLGVREKEIVALVGANGAGKSTLLKVISGLIKPRSGEIRFAGRRVDSLPADAVLRAGIVHVPEGRRVFSDLTVEENLLIGAFSRRDSE